MKTSTLNDLDSGVWHTILDHPRVPGDRSDLLRSATPDGWMS